MGILDYIEELRKKSSGERNRFAAVLSALITFIIIIFWIVTLNIPTINPPDVSIDSEEVSRGTGILGQAVENIKIGFFTLLDTVREGVRSIADLIR